MKRDSTSKLLVWGLLCAMVFSSTFAPIGASAIEKPNNLPSDSVPSEAQSSGSFSWDLSQYEIDDSKLGVITLSEKVMYNITFESTGDADFEIAIVQSIETLNYVTQKTSSSYSNDLLTTAGVPWWGNYNSWDSISYSSSINLGVQIDSGESKSVLIYCDSPNLASTFSITIIVILQATANPLNNLIEIGWSSISFSSVDAIILRSDVNQETKADIAPNSVAKLHFSTEAEKILTYATLNESITSNGSTTVVSWHKDLSGNVFRQTQTISTSSKSIHVPAFQNIQLDSTILPGFAINPSVSNIVELNWTYNQNTDPTLTYSSMSFEGAQLTFQPGLGNKFWKILDIASTKQFKLDFQGINPENLTYWNIAIDFYAIGKKSSMLFNLNSAGQNESESVKIFASPQSNEYKNIATSYSSSNYLTYNYWWAQYAAISPDVGSSTGSHKLGMVISATAGLTLENCTILIDLVDIPIAAHSDSEKVYLGAENGSVFSNFDLFQVRSFDFGDFHQYGWEISARNETDVASPSALYCNNQSTNLYPGNLNNAIVSIPIDTTSLTGTLYLEFDLSFKIKSSDVLYVYVNNSAQHSAALETYSSTFALFREQTIITAYSATDLQIIFNFTTNNNGFDVGPTIDNVEITNGTHTVFLDDFEGEFNQWTQIDRYLADGADDLYWHIARNEKAFNSPRVNVIYPNTVYNMQGYIADPSSYNDLTREFFDFNPYVQPGHTGYLIYEPDSNLVENFSVSLKITDYSPILIANDSKITANKAETQATFQSGLYWEINVAIPDMYEYLSISLDPATEYKLSFWVSNTNTVILPAQILSTKGIDWSENVENFFGFFLVNSSYKFYNEEQTTIYIKFDAISIGFEITMQVEVISRGDDTIDEENSLLMTMIIIAAVLGATNIVSALIIFRMKKKMKNKNAELKPTNKIASSDQ